MEQEVCKRESLSNRENLSVEAVSSNVKMIRKNLCDTSVCEYEICDEEKKKKKQNFAFFYFSHHMRLREFEFEIYFRLLETRVNCKICVLKQSNWKEVFWRDSLILQQFSSPSSQEKFIYLRHFTQTKREERNLYRSFPF